MKKMYKPSFLHTASKILVLLLVVLSFTQKLQAQGCPGPGVSFAPQDANNFTFNTWYGSGCYYSNEYMQVSNVKAGDLLWFSSCADGSNNPYDNQYTLRFNSTTGASVAYNDDNGPLCSGTGASISYLVPSNGAGTYYLLNNKYNCQGSVSECNKVYVLKRPIGIAAETNPLFTAATGCSNGTFRMGAGAYYDVTVAANTYYNWTWNNNGAGNMNSFYLQPLNGNAAALQQTNATAWFSGTTTSVRIHAWRTSSNWVATSGIMTYRHTQPTVGSISTTQVNFCASNGNFGTAVTANSTSNGSVIWDWGSNNGTWNNNWVSGTSSGVCCFPKKVSNSDGNADRVRYRVTNNGCDVTSSTALITNRWNEDPSSLTVNTNNFCTGSVANITLTANFPAAVNMNGTVQFYSGSCGGTLVATVSPGANSSTVSATITAPTVSTDYFARYNPGTGTGCSAGACASIRVNVKPNATAPSSITATETVICNGESTTLTANGGLVAYYPFSSNLNDASGNGLNLSGSGGSFSGGGLQLTTGSTYTSPNTHALNTDNYTLAFQMQYTAPPDGSWRKIFGYNAGGSDRTPGIWKYPSEMRMHWRHDPGNAGGAEATIFTQGVWYDVVGVKQGASFYLYINGNLMETITVPNPKTAGEAQLWFGGAPVILREFKVYNGALNWYSAGCGTTLVGRGPSITVSPSSTTTYNVRLEGACNTTGCVSQTITVNTPSTAPTTMAGSTICTGSPATLNPTGGTLGTAAVNVFYQGTCNVAFEQLWRTQPYSTSGTTVNNVTGGILNVTSTNGDPMINMYSLGSFNPNIYKYVNIRYRVVTGTAGNVEIFFTNSSCGSACGGQMVSAALTSNGNWNTVSVNMASHGSWTSSNVTGWRFDWATASGVNMEIDFIELSESPMIGASATSITVSPTSTTTYTSRRIGFCNSTSCVSATVTVNPINTITLTS
ncbi:MAG: LamG domain-containing protein, partial [Chitinophagales bacterium]|nr:LamG domain-containing protein [Chitinophagales bacterium]